MSYQVIQGDCLDVLPTLPRPACIFADPPDNIDLKYGEYKDKLPAAEYEKLLLRWVLAFVDAAPITWLSFNPKYTLEMAEVVRGVKALHPGLEFKPCVQVFTFGQNNPHDLGNNHRLLWRLRWSFAQLHSYAIKVPSWRERNGDARAKPGGRVPGDVFDMQYPHDPLPGDVFDFPRVTGNSKQRCDWHPTQLHEMLVERCIKQSTLEGESVIDPFGGTGTTLRVCQRINRPCTLIEIDASYCRRIAEANLVPWSKAA